MHNGAIAASSQFGSGTIFSKVVLEMDILIIEDEAGIRENLVELLQNEGFQVASAATGQEAEELLKTEIWDLVICDIMLPDMDGYSILESLRQCSDRAISITQFIFLTAKAERDDQRLAMELGADDYITKPCTAIELIGAINARIQRRNAYLNSPAVMRETVKNLQQKVRELQREATASQIALHKLTEELRRPFSNINMAIKMLKIASEPAARERYISILNEECCKEIALLNQVASYNNVSQELVKFLQEVAS